MIPALLFALGWAAPARAQRTQTPAQEGWRPGRWPTPEVPAPPARWESGPSPLRIVVFGTGGALLGGWTGFVASQVVWSDWRNEPGRSAIRQRYSLIGAGVGILAGVLMGIHSSPNPIPRLGPPAPDLASPNAPITAEQIQASSARSIRELLRELRPRWLRSHGLDVLRQSGRPDQPRGIRVYLNNRLLGGLDSLDDISIGSVTEIRFLDAAAATLRWGAGNEDGALLLTTSAPR